MLNNIPRHIAIVMDGNGRWAQQRLLPRIAGHNAGVESVRAVVRSCIAAQVGVLTLFAFSSENWRRPAAEVMALMELFKRSLSREVKELHAQGIRVRFIGDRQQFDKKLQIAMQQAEDLTLQNGRLTLVIAINYGGRWDITHAVQNIVKDVVEDRLLAANIDEDCVGRYMALHDLPEPDLLVRTSGEQRISNFLLWQLAYTELYFSPYYWPDFREQAFAEALEHYQSRQRRFGHIGEQMG